MPLKIIISFPDRSDADKVSEADFQGYKGIFTLTIVNTNEDYLEYCIENSIAALVGHAMYTKILGKTYVFKDLKKLLKDDTAMIVGALLLKFSVITFVSCTQVHLIDPNDTENLHDRDPSAELINKAYSVATLHTLSGCFPNVNCCPGHGNKFITHAIRPIKAGDKLIAHFKSESIWSKLSTKSSRQADHVNLYGSACSCIACRENWSEDFTDNAKARLLAITEASGFFTSIQPEIVKLWNESNSILLEWKANSHKPSFPDTKILYRTIDLARSAWLQVSMPSAILTRCVVLLIEVYRIFHDPSEIYNKQRDLRKQVVLDVVDIPGISERALNHFRACTDCHLGRCSLFS
ncbi:hypothetical protein QAD02_011353 [Eretmocerus hayati]|uniref:Uncharacterized protein n=1 Tax=Eretmocerus hayati TaxID=131215 RepID=A0ACC2NZE1_9HYME|nr:hypothetical protein QAD02_011353 [Eretmocerus hayati]